MTANENVKTESPIAPNSQKAKWAVAACSIVVLCVYCWKEIPSSDWYRGRKAEATAREYVSEKFVVDRIADKSEVHKTGMGEYEVQLTVDRKNAMGGPIRDKMILNVAAYGGWHVKEFKKVE